MPELGSKIRKPPKLGPQHIMLGGFLLVILLNILSVKLFGFPFLYCWGRGLAFALYDTISTALSVALVCYMFYCVFRLSLRSLWVPFLLLAANLSLPMYATILFKLGGSCG